MCSEKKVPATEQRQCFREKFGSHRITTRLYGEAACFDGEGLPLMGQSRFKFLNPFSDLFK